MSNNTKEKVNSALGSAYGSGDMTAEEIVSFLEDAKRRWENVTEVNDE